MDKFIKKKTDSDRSDSSNNEQQSSSKSTPVKKANIHWLYSDNYLKYGFHWTGNAQMPSPLCVVCDQKLSNEAMVPIKMNRHFTTNHPSLQTKNSDYFQRLLQSNAKQSKLFQKTRIVSEKAPFASYEVAELIALNQSLMSLQNQ